MDLEKWMGDNGMDPCIIKALLSGLRHWCNDTLSGEIRVDDTLIFVEQEKIGWDSVL
jgi:hypothetical protein